MEEQPVSTFSSSRHSVFPRQRTRCMLAYMAPSFSHFLVSDTPIRNSLWGKKIGRLNSMYATTILTLPWSKYYIFVRRFKLSERFAIKAAANPAFTCWFPLAERSDYPIRNPKKYQEYHARTERLRRSPIYMCRRLPRWCMKCEILDNCLQSSIKNT